MQRNIQDVAHTFLGIASRAREEWHLMAAYKEGIFVSFKYSLGSIAVMYVKIYYGYSLNIMVVPGMQSTDSNIV